MLSVFLSSGGRDVLYIFLQGILPPSTMVFLYTLLGLPYLVFLTSRDLYY